VRGAGFFGFYIRFRSGLLESAFEAALAFEFVMLGGGYKTQVPNNFFLKAGLGLGYRMVMLMKIFWF
jgi:hypothetical protein